MSSAAKPVNQPDALHLLLNRVQGGGDATLIADGDAARVLLDLAADCLSGRRTRLLWAAEVLPSRLTAGVPDDDALSRGFQAMTVLDAGCDRIVLLIEDAHTLKRSALRYIQLAGRSAAHLQLVFCGTRAFLDMLNAEEFAWLRTRLATGLALTLAAPIPEKEDAPPAPPSPHDPPAWAGESPAPLPASWGPAVCVSRPWRLRLGALALLALAGTAGLVLGVRGNGTGGPAAGRPVASVAQSLTPLIVPAPEVPLAAHAQDAPASPSNVPAAPPAAKAPSPLVTVRSPPRAGMPEKEPQPPDPLPSAARSLRQPSAPAAASRVASAAPGSRARRLRDANDQPAPPRDEQWASSLPEYGSWTAPVSQPPRYIGSYTTDANGVRMFHSEP